MNSDLKNNLILLSGFIIGWLIIYTVSFYLALIGYPLYNAIAIENAPLYIALQRLTRAEILFFIFWLIHATWMINSFDFLFFYLFVVFSVLYILNFFVITLIYRNKNLIYLT